MSAKQEQPSKIKIEIDGQPVDDLFIEDILQVVVEESLHVPSMCIVTLRNDYFPGNPKQEKPWQHSRWLQIGKSISITLQGSTTTIFCEQKENSLFSGEITGIESYFTENSQAPITIRAYDVSHRLHRGRYNRSFQNMTDSDIVEKIAKEVRIETKAIASSGAPYDYVFQENQTNMEFLRSRAFRLGFELYVQDNKLYFAKPESRGSLDLKWLKDLNSFRVRISSAEQVSSVEVRGWDYQEKRAIIATAEQEKVITQNQNGSGSDISTQFQLDSQPPKMIVVDRPVASDKEANNIAQAICNELGGSADQDIKQAIQIILRTELGERVYRPDFGCRLFELTFAPMNTRTLFLTEDSNNAMRTADVILHLPQNFPAVAFTGYEGCWLRCTYTEPQREQSGYLNSPKITGIKIRSIGGTVAAKHSTLLRDELLGNSNGKPGQTFQLQTVPILDRRPEEHILVIPPGLPPQTWQEVADFASSTPEDRHYTLDSLTGTVQFGPLIQEPSRHVHQTNLRSQLAQIPALQDYPSRAIASAEGTLERQYGSIPPVVQKFGCAPIVLEEEVKVT